MSAGKAAFLAIALFAMAGAKPVMAADRPVSIFAAASLKEALDAVAVSYRKTGGAISISYAGSNTLARQIEQGAPADIFISADTDWMQYLSTRKLLREASAVPLLHNSMVMIAPRSGAAPLDLTDPAALPLRLRGERLAVADTNSVPAGRYARAALEKLGLWASVSAHLAQAENVRTALLFVARGEAPLGIVYATDAKSEPRVSIVAQFPPGSYPPVVYPAAIVKDSTNPGADAVFAFLKSAPVQDIFEGFGFIIPGKSGGKS